MIDIEASRAICQAATEGPWRVDNTEPDDVVVWSGPRGEDANLVANVGPKCTPVGVVNGAWLPDAAFIAHARTALPEALGEIERLRKEVAKLETVIDGIYDRMP